MYVGDLAVAGVWIYVTRPIKREEDVKQHLLSAFFVLVKKKI